MAQIGLKLWRSQRNNYRFPNGSASDNLPLLLLLGAGVQVRGVDFEWPASERHFGIMILLSPLVNHSGAACQSAAPAPAGDH